VISPHERWCGMLLIFLVGFVGCTEDNTSQEELLREKVLVTCPHSLAIRNVRFSES